MNGDRKCFWTSISICSLFNLELSGLMIRVTAQKNTNFSVLSVILALPDSHPGKPNSSWKFLWKVNLLIDLCPCFCSRTPREAFIPGFLIRILFYGSGSRSSISNEYGSKSGSSIWNKYGDGSRTVFFLPVFNQNFLYLCPLLWFLFYF